MRIADAVASLAARPDAVLVGNDAAHDLAVDVAERLGVPTGPGRPDTAAAVVVLVAVVEEELTEGVDEGLVRAGGLAPEDQVLVLLDAGRDGLPVEAAAAAAAAHGLELVAVIDVAHPVLTVALHLVGSDQPELAAARTDLRLERAASRRIRAAARATARELDRRGERIDSLRTQVTELRERLETLETNYERAVASQDRHVASLRRKIQQLESSTSYRIGHALVRLSKGPRLLLRLPGRLLRWLRS